MRTFHLKIATSEGGGGLHILSWKISTNRKNISAYVSEHCASFETKKLNLATLEGEGAGVCMLFSRNNPVHVLEDLKKASSKKSTFFSS